MKRFYAHLAAKDPVAYAFNAAKRDVLKTYGAQAIPFAQDCRAKKSAGLPQVVLEQLSCAPYEHY